MYNHSECKQLPVNRATVEEQLTKIFRHPLFHESEILKKFLEFIVEETFEGRANCLKEYTIAVHALNKPVNFRPQDNGIVRIHAGRLRRALRKYYEESAKPGETSISIPKGKYVPVFGNSWSREEEERDQEALSGYSLNSDFSMRSKEFISDKHISISVLPFSCPVNRESIKFFCEGLCMQLSSGLMQLKNVSVIAYQAMKSLAESDINFRDIMTAAGTDYLISGNAQNVADRLRVNIQVINCKKSEQVWAGLYERKMTGSNVFELQDEITATIISAVEKSFSVTLTSARPSRTVAIAAV